MPRKGSNSCTYLCEAICKASALWCPLLIGTGDGQFPEATMRRPIPLQRCVVDLATGVLAWPQLLDTARVLSLGGRRVVVCGCLDVLPTTNTTNSLGRA